MSDPTNTAPPRRESLRYLRLQGLLLFLFIPVVLVLFVQHPSPLAGSFGLGVVLMVGHRFLARPYMQRAAAAKCLWCNRTFLAGEPSVPLALTTGKAPQVEDESEDPEKAQDPAEPAETQPEKAAFSTDSTDTISARCCVGHREPAARFFAWLGAIERPLKAGIFLPLLVLLLALAAASFGAPRALAHLAQITASFQFLVGVTVQLAAIGPFVCPPVNLESTPPATRDGRPVASSVRSAAAASR